MSIDAAQAPRPTGTALLYGLLERAKQFPDAITLGRGDPDFPTPEHIRAAAREAAARGDPAPPPVEGLPALREAIAARLHAVNGIAADPSTEIVVTQGGQEAIALMALTALRPGDEIIVPEPNYNTFKDAIALAGARSVPVVTSVDEDFAVDVARIAAAVTERTRALLLVSPNNPSAAVIPPDQVRALAALAEDRDLLVLADDTYDRFLYDGAVHLSPAALPGMKRRTLTLNTLSKTYAMTGWRVGWVAGPEELMRRLRRVKEAVSGGTSVVAQHAGIAALTGPQEAVAAMHQAYIRRRRIILDALDAMGLTYGRPLGGQFVFIDARRYGRGSLELCSQILEEAHVLVYPGVSFGEAWDGFLRMTFLQPEELLREGLRRMADVLGRLG
jgi:aminotransferase